MKLEFSALVAAASGSVAGNTFSHNAGGPYVRRRATPTNPSTVAQQEVRSRLAELASHWGNTLTQAQRDGWVTFGQNFPSTDSLGKTIVLSGSQAYSRVNARLLSAGLTRVDTAPADQDVTDLITMSATMDVGTGATRPGVRGSIVQVQPIRLVRVSHHQVEVSVAVQIAE